MNRKQTSQYQRFIEVGISKEQNTAIESINEVRKLLLTYLLKENNNPEK